MKRTKKTIFGYFSLLLVAIMTLVAAKLPSPEAIATSSSVTDIITVRVISTAPSVVITQPASGSIFVDPAKTVSLSYEHLSGYTWSLVGPVSDSGSASGLSGAGTSNIDLSVYLEQGGVKNYGDYTFRVQGTGSNGGVAEDIITFSYLPVTATVEENDKTGKIYAELNYDDNNIDLDHFVIEIRDENGNLISPLSPITVLPPTKRVELPFYEYDLPAGKYTVSVAAYSVSNNLIYRSYDIIFNYQPLAVPDTGGLLGLLNISRADYLITGLLIFLIVGVGGLVFVAKHKDA